MGAVGLSPPPVPSSLLAALQLETGAGQHPQEGNGSAAITNPQSAMLTYCTLQSTVRSVRAASSDKRKISTSELYTMFFFLRLEHTTFGPVVLHGNVKKKLMAGLFYFLH